MAMSGASVTRVERGVTRRKAPDVGQYAIWTPLIRELYQLAYALVKNRQTALDILHAAICKLRARCSRERKRSYWRERALKRRITRVIRRETDVLQWLVWLEATHHEKQQENAGSVSEGDMILRYIKHLTQLTSGMSSFHVSVALQRLVYNYATPEARKAYERLTDLYPNPEAYRTTKAMLMDQLKQRFGNALNIFEAERGERRFEVREGQEGWANFVDGWLQLLVPWSTRQACSSFGFNSSDGVPAAGWRYPGITADEREMLWSHAFIHSPCHEELTRMMELDRPRDRLALPKFYNALDNDNKDMPENFGANDQGLADDEVETLLERLISEDPQQKKVLPKRLRIMADGMECAQIDVLGPASRVQCELAESVKLLEVWAEINGKNILVGTHWIDYTRWDGVAPVLASLRLSTQRELRFDIKPTGKAAQRRIQLRLECRHVSGLLSWRESVQAAGTAGRYALLTLSATCALLFAVGWITSLLWHNHLLKQRDATIQQLQSEVISQREARQSAEARFLSGEAFTYALTPNELRQRSGHGAEANVVRVSTRTNSIILALPVGVRQASSYRADVREFLGKQKILSEGNLMPQAHTSDTIVSVEVPLALFKSGGEYVVDLYARVGSSDTKIHTFRFQLFKN